MQFFIIEYFDLEAKTAKANDDGEDETDENDDHNDSSQLVSDDESDDS